MYLLSKILGFLLLPDTLLVGLFVVVLGLAARRRIRRGRLAAAAGLVLLLIAAFLPLGDWCLGPLENRFPRPESLPAHVDGVIVLGGTIDLPASENRGQVSLKRGAEVFIEAVSLMRRFPQARLVFSGGAGWPGAIPLREADVAQAIFSSLGLAADRITYERRSRNTRENALFSKAAVHPGANETWLLVAPASDMPRDVGCFRAVGWPVVAWPTGYRTLQDGAPLILPGPGELSDIDLAVHEWLGLVYYRLRGWTDALFPAVIPSSPFP